MRKTQPLLTQLSHNQRAALLAAFDHQIDVLKRNNAAETLAHIIELRNSFFITLDIKVNDKLTIMFVLRQYTKACDEYLLDVRHEGSCANLIAWISHHVPNVKAVANG